jgi:urease accessory protein
VTDAAALTPAFEAAATPATARLSFVRAGPGTAVEAAFAESPLRLLTPRNHGAAAWVYTSTFGGGFVDGDRVALSVRVGAGARGFLSTQGPTRVHGGPRGCESVVDADVGGGALLALVPDAVACFAGAAYEARTQVRLAPDASLVLLELLTAGRLARGERWAQRRSSSTLRVSAGGRAILDEQLLLDPAHGPLAERLGRFDALATLVLVGPLVPQTLPELAPAARGDALVEAASPLPGGLLLRLAATSHERLLRALRARLSFLPALLGDDPWRHSAG